MTAQTAAMMRKMTRTRRGTAGWALAWLVGVGLAGNCSGQLRFERTTVSVPANGADRLVAEFPFVVGPAGPVVIGAVKPDCSCSVGTLEKNFYEPGEKGRIRLEFRAADYVGPQEKRLFVEASDQPQPHVLTLVTDLPRVADVSPKTVYWDHAAPLAGKVVTFETAAGQPLVTALRAVSDHPAVTVGVKETVPGRRFELRLTPAATTQVLVARVDFQVIYENKTERAFYCFAMVKPEPE